MAAATTMLSSLQTTLFLVLPLSSLLFLLLLLLRDRRRRNKSTSHGSGLLLPPSPPRLPLIGNLHQLGPLLHRSLAARARTLGSLMLLHLGHARALVVSSPDAACDVLLNQDQSCAGRPATSAAKILLYGCEDLFFTPYGEHWRQLRKICAVHLLGPKRVQSYCLAREEEVASMIASISASAAAAGGVVDISAALFTFTNDVVCRVVSGKIKEEEGRNEMFASLIEENVTLLAKFYLGDYFPWLGWADRFVAGYLKRAEENRRRWDDLLDQMIKEHEDRAVRAEKKKKNDGRDAELEEKDFVDVLVSLKKEAGLMESFLTPSSIKALLVDMYGAGTDTSYITLEWAMAELIRSPGSMRRLQEEVRGKTGRKEMVREEEIKEMRYLKAVVKEILRLHPPAPLLVPREVVEDGVVIQGYAIPRKTRILVNVWAIHRDPNYWDEPEEFRPERFTEEGGGGGAPDFNGTDFRFLPFGAGRRICLGLQFAVALLELALANLVHHFDWELPAGMRAEEFHMREADGIVIQREGRLHLVAKPWRASAAV